MRAYDQDGAAVLEGFGPDEIPDACRNQVCYPWINRLAAGEWDFSGRRARVGANNLLTQTSNHGIVRWRPFAIDVVDDDHCRLSCLLHPTPEYPFLTRFSVDYTVGPDGLSVRSTVANLDDVTVPFSLGYHPYFAMTTPSIEGRSCTSRRRPTSLSISACCPPVRR